MKLIVGAWLAMASLATAQEVTDSSGVDLEASMLSAVLAKVSENFRDPSSVQFRGLHAKNSGADVCGEVNAQNAFGAYVGYMPFVYDVESEGITILDLTDRITRTEAGFKLAQMVLMGAGCTYADGTFNPY